MVRAFKQKSSASIVRFVVILLPILVWTGCAYDKKLVTLSSCYNPAQVALFQNTLYPKLTQNCVSCHGISQGPLFAVPNAAQSYGAALSVVNLAHYTSSKILMNASNGHCGNALYCSLGGQTLADFTDALKTWVDGENANPMASACSTPPALPTFTTADIALPANLPLSNVGVGGNPFFGDNFVDMNWNLDFVGPDFRGAVFRIRAQQYNVASAAVPGAYRFIMPRIISPNTSLHVGQIDILVNDVIADSTYETVDRVINANASNPPVLSALSSTLVVQQGMNDMISISIGLAKSAPVACKNVALFASNVLGNAGQANTMTTSCVGCHNSAGNPAMAAFPMTTNRSAAQNAALCALALQHVDKNDILNSPLLRLPRQGGGNMPPVANFDRSQWITWIQSEYAN